MMIKPKPRAESIIKSKNIKVVIGANFGDEGKGLMTDYFASSGEGSLVVRFNGGAQAGHTVTTPEGLSHVFSHFGSGTLSGIPTYLSSFFLVNPMLFSRERQVLCDLGANLVDKLYVDTRCPVTTPYDMLINQAAELSRGGNRHGSCGLGISETVVRSEYANGDYLLTVEDMFDIISFRAKTERIRSEYVPRRLMELGIVVPDQFVSAFEDDNILEAYLDDVAFFVDNVKFCTDKIITNFDSIIFEGAQGLLLDQDLVEYSPHITHSSTGLVNVLRILAGLNLTYDLEAVYVTRCYLTRHGAGPLPNEISGTPYPRVLDPTNIPNEWQGALRFGILDLDRLRNQILRDLQMTSGDAVKYSLAVTCLDQVDDKVRFILGGREHLLEPEEFLRVIASTSTLPTLYTIYTSYGNTRETIKKQEVDLL